MTPKTPEEIRKRVRELRNLADCNKRTYVADIAKDAADALEWLLQFVEWKPLTEEDKTETPKLCFQNKHRTYSVNRWKSAWAIVGNVPEHEASLWVPLPPPPQQSHWSDCAVNNAPALPVGECNCGGYVRDEDVR